jgi:hypothetical protein
MIFVLIISIFNKFAAPFWEKAAQSTQAQQH